MPNHIQLPRIRKTIKTIPVSKKQISLKRIPIQTMQVWEWDQFSMPSWITRKTKVIYGRIFMRWKDVTDLNEEGQRVKQTPWHICWTNNLITNKTSRSKCWTAKYNQRDSYTSRSKTEKEDEDEGISS